MLSEERATGAPELSIYQGSPVNRECRSPTMKQCTCGSLLPSSGPPLCARCTQGVREYERAHRVLAIKRGTAGKHRCPCGQAATQWAYNNACTREQTDTRGRRWCPHPQHYDAMCYPCHRDMDEERRRSE